MAASAHCRDCGAPLISRGALEGRCPSCLLNLAAEDGDGAASLTWEGITRPVLPADSQIFTPGLILGDRYRLLRFLGRGGQGEVWHAFDLKLRVEVALKALRPDLISDAQSRELLRREVRNARQVLSPNVCRVYDLIVEDGQEMVSMELVDGTTLARLLTERGPLDLSQAWEIAAQLLAGLEAIHIAGLVHRDLKPENVMLTLSRRVVVMDLGIARSLGEQARTVAGTAGYMSPEQAGGLPLDARSDVFSAGVILAEMVSSTAFGSKEARRRLWAELRQEPPSVPPGPWSPVLRRALGQSREGRYATAGALARALELQQHDDGRVEHSPYPGLLPFTKDDARVFFGREIEVESLIRRLRRARLRAVVGPSGAGKSSFLRAGVVPALAAGWSALLCTPGDKPFAAFAQALARELAGDAEALALLSELHDPSTCIALAQRWRRRHEHALLVIDQAEELFTLNGPKERRRFTEVLGQLVLEADVHVIVSIRDDFLLQCQSFESLRPIFSELTPLAPPSGDALRRALVQPALLSGYRFEDERLVHDILRDVAQERGTLPLLAFALARLWEHRDRERGLLTRRAYEDIGGVAGALAQHAEATLDMIGATRIPIVREILRNLVTAEGTRAPQGWDELLSAFSDERRESEEILQRLVEARLLTAFEGPHDERRTTGQRRVEIIHESLLASWPRLARWRDEDAEGARLRDQLRQAAHLWDERGRPTDLLWSGQSFAEYLLWKPRYVGRLTEREQSFGRAMEAQAARQRLRARLGIGAAFAALLMVLGVVSQLWMRSRASEAQALHQAQRAEAQQLLALGQVAAESNPTLGLAYAIAALERSDTDEIRRFALGQLWKGPLAFVLTEHSNQVASSLAFSSDGEWLADWGRGLRLFGRNSSGPHNLDESFGDYPKAGFSTDGRRLLVFGRTPTGRSVVDTVSLPDLTRLGRIEINGEGLLAMRGNTLITASPRMPNGLGADVVLRSLAGGSPKRLGALSDRARRLKVDATGETYLSAYSGDRRLLASTLEAGDAGQHPVFSIQAPIADFWRAAAGNRVAVLDAAGGLGVGSLTDGRQLRLLPGPPLRRQETVNDVAFDSGGRWVAAAVERQGLRLWSVTGPPDAEPIVLGRGAVTATMSAAFEPTDRWLAVEDLRGISFWPVRGRWSSVFRVSDDQPRDVAFSPDGKWIAAASRLGGVDVWPLSDASHPRRHFAEGIRVTTLAVSPDGRFLATGSHGKVLVLPVSGARALELTGFQSLVYAVAFDATGRRIAATGRVSPRQSEVVRVIDLETGRTKDFDPGDGMDIATVSFLPDGDLLTSSFGGLHRIDVETGSSERLLAQPGLAFLGPDGTRVLLLHTDNGNFPVGTASVHDLRTRGASALTSHGSQVTLMAWDPSGRHVVTGSRDGTVRVGPVTGEQPHLLIGHTGPIWGVRVDATGRLIASASEDGTVRIWPMPDGQPLHTWPRAALLEKLRSLTNVRVVPDASTATGYRETFLPFPGWDREPATW